MSKFGLGVRTLVVCVVLSLGACSSSSSNLSTNDGSSGADGSSTNDGSNGTDGSQQDGTSGSEDGTGKDSKGSEQAGKCSLPTGGRTGEIKLTPQQPKTLDEFSATALNTVDHLKSGQLVSGAIGACGTVGVLLRVKNGNDRQLMYSEPKGTGAPEVVDPDVPNSVRAVLFYDSDCKPVVLRGSSTTGLTEYTRSDSKEWKPAVVADLKTLLGGAIGSFEPMGRQLSDGKLYLFAHITLDGAPKLLRSERSLTAGSSWTAQALPRPTATQFLSYRVSPAGTHAVYRNTEFPCNSCNVDLFFGTLSGDSWTQQVVQPGKWGAPDDEFVESASLVFDTTGRPFIAAHFIRRVITGSYKSAELRIYTRGSGGDWCNETVVTNSKGFQGSDGDGFTGADPQLRIDKNGRLHILFRDQAVWHDGTGQNEIRGQPRYATFTDVWTVSSLLDQPGQTESTNPLVGFNSPLFLVSPDGAEVVVFGVNFSWQTDSIYNNQDQPTTYKAQLIIAAP